MPVSQAQTKFHIIQSNDINKLFGYLLEDYKNKSSHIFEPFIVIVPSKVMGDWLKKQVADQTGISTLVTAEFWGRYQWTLMQQVLQTYAKFEPRKALRVPEVAVLSKNVMQWRLFGYFNAEKYTILQDTNHPLFPLLEPLISLPVIHSSKEKPLFSPIEKAYEDIPKWLRKKSFIDKNRPAILVDNPNQPQDFQTASDDQRLWQLASDMASMLNRYMTYRPHWLALWAKGEAVNVKQLIAEKDELNAYMMGVKSKDESEDNANNTPHTPDWLIEHYEHLETAQRYLWQVLFDETYQYRRAIERQFWHALTHDNPEIATACRDTLPEQLTLFTIQQLPKTELAMMARLAKFTNIKLLHYNPSEMFWADIVDKNWLAQQTYINPEAIYYKDHGHTLLSRFGKQSREVFAMLADFSGNDFGDNGEIVTWTDDFQPVIEEDFSSNSPTPTLLAQLQQDILMLQESKDSPQQAVANLLEQIEHREYKPNRPWQLSQIDNSLSIHACHSMVRQLEVLRAMIIGWLNYADKPYLLKGLAQQETIDFNPALKGKKSAKKANNTAQLSIFDFLENTQDTQTTQTEANLAEDSNQPQIQLNRANRRSLSDILVLLPDIEAQQAVIESIFPKGVGTDGYDLPAKVTGVTSKDINQLWSAITGFFTLLQTTQHSSNSAVSATSSNAGQASGQSVARFDRASVFDWLMLPPLVESYGLTHEQMSRGCELLEMAGFARGFDERHLATTLHESDDDYRYSFVYALDRLVAGLLMPNATTTQFGEYINRYGEPEKILPLEQVQMGDSAVIAVLCDIFSTIDRLREVGTKTATAGNWLIAFERFIKEKFDKFMQTNALNSIWSALNSFKKNNEANQRYAKSYSHSTLKANIPTIDPDKLPLKLGFILASIESELASQQVSAEPSGVITFGRVGAVRNLPYKLVVMLNMNLSNFPNRDKANRYDLMQAGKSERGDRFKEDDELGAFLDAILSAKEACWLFYNGASTSDDSEHLPASPVGELIDFLQGEVNWQLDDKSQFSSKNANQFIKEWLITKHPELPFQQEYFYTPTLKANATAQDRLDYQVKQIKHAQKSLYPPAPLWYSVFEQVYQEQKSLTLAPEKIAIPTKATLKKCLNTWDSLQNHLQGKGQNQNAQTHSTDDIPTQYVNLSQLIRAVQQPAKTFIQAQRLHLSQYANDGQNIEPIELDNLGKYQINARLLEEKLLEEKLFEEKLANTPQNPTSLNELVYSNELPAGVSRYISIHAQRQKIHNDTLAFLEKLQTLDSTAFPNVANVIQKFGDTFTLADIITPCQEQRLAVSVATITMEHAKINTLPTVTDDWQTIILTANFPTLFPTVSHDSDKAIDTGYWINYLPTSGREKYQVQFWLNHLAWQVARGTTHAQASEDNGFSLWQFSDKKTVYLPPIDSHQALAWLQDWLMAWQLYQQSVVILPPSVALKVLAEIHADPKGDSKPDIFSALTKTNWKINTYNKGDFVSEDDPSHLYWAFLLKDKNPIKAIVPFVETWGERLYLPILEKLQTVENMVMEDKK